VIRAVQRAVLVGFVAVAAGSTAYASVPVPSAAAPGLATVVTAAPVVVPSMAPVPGLVAGLIDGDDLVTDPEGISTVPVVGVDGALIGWPVSDHTPSTGFGYRSDPFTHKQRWHDGVDLGQPCGDAVHVSLDGTVAFTGWAGGYGNRIIVRHADRGGHTFSTTYNHLSKIEVTAGQVLKQGDVIARIGSTGRSTACHLHFEVILDGSYVDPMRFLTGDQSKASLSRRVGSYMPSGLPSPHVPTTVPSIPSGTTDTSTKTPKSTPTPTPTPTTASPSPTPTTPAPTTPGASTTSPTPTPTDTPTATTTPESASPGNTASASHSATSTTASTAATPSAARSGTPTADNSPTSGSTASP